MQPINDLLELKNRISSDLITPSDDEYSDAARPWNRAVLQAPLAIVDAESAADIVSTVRFAASKGWGISVQPLGHGASGSVDNTILVRTRRLNHVRLDKKTGVATVGAGASVGDVQAVAAQHGLTALAGSTPAVNLLAIALGGGLSWFSRSHGWVSGSIIAINIIDASGVQRRVTGESDPDLFWAVRGGGGDFAIVTEADVQLYEAKEIAGGRLLWPDADRRVVLKAFRDITDSAPRSLSTWLHLLTFPGAPPMVALDVAYLGSEGELRDLLQPLSALPAPIKDTITTLRADELGTIAAEPTDPAPGSTRFGLLNEISDEVIETLATAEYAPVMIVQLRHLGGALSDPSDLPSGQLHEQYSVSFFGVPASVSQANAIRSIQDDLSGRLPLSGRVPFVFLEAPGTAGDAFSDEVLKRLQTIKADVDPQGIFRSNFSVARVENSRAYGRDR